MNEIKKILKERLNNNKYFNQMINFDKYLIKLNDDLLSKINYMEKTGGMPEMIIYDNKVIIVELSLETPNRRSVCYDKDARLSRKKFPPEESAIEIANKNGLEIVDEKMYNFLQTIKKIDQKTSSWLKTNKDFRKLGGALTGERRYDRVFIYHNGAESYYNNRSFRTYIIIDEVNAL